jgi:signal transduction histidine kinase
MLDLLVRWLDERDTADYQASLLSVAHQNVESSRQLHDDMLQTLFATSLLISELKADKTGLPPELAQQIEANDRALEEARERLQSHLKDS